MTLDDELAKVERYRAALLAAIEARAVFVQDAAQGARPDSAERVLAASAGHRQCAGPGCTTLFAARSNGGRGKGKLFCSALCRQRASRVRKSEQDDASWRAQTKELRQLHESEGLSKRELASDAEATEDNAL
jgi:hypothetical protein